MSPSAKRKIKIANGDEVEGTKLVVPGWEHVDLLFVRADEGLLGYTVFEESTGLRLFPLTTVARKKEDAIRESKYAMDKLEEWNKGNGGFAGCLNRYMIEYLDGKPLNQKQTGQRRLL